MKKIDFRRLRTYSIKSRKSKVSVSGFCGPYRNKAGFSDFFNSLPAILAGEELRRLVESIVRARQKGKHVIIGMGAHPIKVGLSPLLVQAMETRTVTGFALNGACLVHDFEIAYAGMTSEDVEMTLGDGSFGMTEETGRIINSAIKRGIRRGMGIGKAVGEIICKDRMKYADMSILGTAYRLKVPVSVHVALGTDIIHFHSNADAGAIGRGTMLDFKLFATLVAGLSGGVFLNVGSAVIIPEVFLKAVTIARNLGNSVKNITTANLDFIQHYRPLTNVVSRPVRGGGRGIAITGHHEIMLPLLFWTVMERLGVRA